MQSVTESATVHELDQLRQERNAIAEELKAVKQTVLLDKSIVVPIVELKENYIGQYVTLTRKSKFNKAPISDAQIATEIRRRIRQYCARHAIEYSKSASNGTLKMTCHAYIVEAVLQEYVRDKMVELHALQRN